MPEYKRREGISDKEFLNHKWFKSRPKHIKKAILAHPPWFWYHLTDGPTGAEYHIHSYEEPEEEGGKVTVKVNRMSRLTDQFIMWQKGAIDRPDRQVIVQVFGVDPDKLRCIKLNSNASES